MTGLRCVRGVRRRSGAGRRWPALARWAGRGTRLLLPALVACGGRGDDRGSPERGGATVPAALVGTEFLVAAGDSTYWVHVEAAGVRVRSAPLLLAWDARRAHEIRLVEQIVDYREAEFIEEQLWAEPIAGAARRDSVLLFRDGAVGEAQRAWRALHPGELPIDPELEEAPEPASSASDYVTVLDVHGPWVSWSHALDIDVDGLGGHVHRRRRGVTSVRTGAPATLDSLVSPAEASRLHAAGRAEFATIRAAVARAGAVPGGDERAARARTTLHTFVFDEHSFSITDAAGAPAVRFHVAGVDEDGQALEFTLPPLPWAERPAWWSAVEGTLVRWAADSSGFTWQTGGLVLVGDVDGEGASVTLTLRVAPAAGQPAPAGGEPSLPVAVLPQPVGRVFDLRAAAIDAAERAALAAAFDRARGEDPYATRVRAPARSATGLTFHPASR